MRRREFVCVDLGGTNLKIGLVGEDGKVIRRKRISMKTHVTKQSLYAVSYTHLTLPTKASV